MDLRKQPANEPSYEGKPSYRNEMILNQAKKVVSELDNLNSIQLDRAERDDPNFDEHFTKPSVSLYRSGHGRVFNVEMEADKINRQRNESKLNHAYNSICDQRILSNTHYDKITKNEKVT